MYHVCYLPNVKPLQYSTEKFDGPAAGGIFVKNGFFRRVPELLPFFSKNQLKQNSGVQFLSDTARTRRMHST